MSNLGNQSPQSEWTNREIGALWKRVAKNNKSTYCTGYVISDELGNKVKQRVIMFSNRNKNNEKSPDFILYLSNEQEGDSAANKQSTPAKSSAPPKRVAQPASADIDDDGVPM